MVNMNRFVHICNQGQSHVQDISIIQGPIYLLGDFETVSRVVLCQTGESRWCSSGLQRAPLLRSAFAGQHAYLAHPQTLNLYDVISLIGGRPGKHT